MGLTGGAPRDPGGKMDPGGNMGPGRGKMDLDGGKMDPGLAPFSLYLPCSLQFFSPEQLSNAEMHSRV